MRRRPVLPLVILLAAAATGNANAATWTTPTVLQSGFQGVPAQLVAGPDGGLAALWIDQHDNRQTLAGSFWPAQDNGFEPPVPLSADYETPLDPGVPRLDGSGALLVPMGWYLKGGHFGLIDRPPGGPAAQPYEPKPGQPGLLDGAVATTPDDTDLAVWRTGQTAGGNSEIWSATRPPGGSFGTPVELSAQATIPHPPQIAVDEAGNATAAWQGPSLMVDYRPVGGPWAPATAVPVNGPIASFALAVVPDGRTILAWNAGGTVFAADGQGAVFSTAQRVGPSDYLATIQLATDANGHAALGWTTPTTSTTFPRPVFAVRPSGGNWSAPHAVGGCGGTRRALAVDPDGDVVALWDDQPGGYESSAAPRPGSVAAALFHVGGGWSSPEQVSVAGENASGPAVAIGAAGQAVVVYRGMLDGVARVMASTTTNNVASAAASAPTGADDAIGCAVPPPPTPPATPPQPAPLLALAARARWHGSTSVVLAVRCPTGGPACRGFVALRLRTRIVGQVDLRLGTGRRASERIVVRGLPRRSPMATAIGVAYSSETGRPTIVRRVVELR